MRTRTLLILLSFTLLPAGLPAAEPMRAVLLNHSLGDPANPGNLKISVNLPPALLDGADDVSAVDFRVHVHPLAVDPAEGIAERYLARGLYLWRNDDTIFLDLRTLPHQEAEGAALVQVEYAPEGGGAALRTVAEGSARYDSDLVDVVLAVDVSRSMNNNDPRKRRVAAARTFIEMAKRGGGVGRVALVTFNQRATRTTPLIPLDQGDILLSALNSVGADGMTNLDDPLSVGLAELSGARNPVIILLTDGRNEGHRYRNTHLAAANAGVRIFSVGLSEHADHDLLREMAARTDGIYFRAVSDSNLTGIYARLAAELGKRQLLHGEVLTTPHGAMTLPIDGTISRLVAIADGGGRVGVQGPGREMFASEDMTSVHVSNPSPANWDVSWDGALPGTSTLGFFGDTRFFLDVFPPQLQHRRLAIGATLAGDEKPLTGGKVWVEAVPGLIPRRFHLYDDGEHGDGRADDGVYGAALELPEAPARIDLIARAGGPAWDQGDFVRQKDVPAIQSDRPPPGIVRLAGDVDFGVLFPGETGTAVASLEFEADGETDLDMDLAWGNGASGWPDFSSTVSVAPGSHEFELEMTVPEDALPGDYAGRFRVGNARGVNASSAARVRVGDVRFAHDGAIDLGDVPPGTFISRHVAIRYGADKDAPLAALARGSVDLTLVNPPDSLSAGEGEIDIEAVVSAPMGTAEGDHSGLLVLESGPGGAEIPIRWRVRPYAPRAARDIAPVSGLPPAPELGTDAKPLESTRSGDDLWTPESGAPDPDLASPWEETERIFSGRRETPGEDAEAYVIPEVDAPGEGWNNFWSAWWVYILAALLLLLLLLLLLAYILYRLGRSAMARFILASALANLVLLGLFILLLGAEDAGVRAAPPTVSVNLVENDGAETMRLTALEEELMGAVGNEALSPSSGGVEIPEAGIAADSDLAPEKAARIPAGADVDESVEFARLNEPAAVRIENELSRPMRRRERQPDREADANLPSPEPAEMTEPAPESAARRGGEGAVVDEARLDIDDSADRPNPVWSEDGRPLEALPGGESVLFAGEPALEPVRFEENSPVIDPRGRRRNPDETLPPEPVRLLAVSVPAGNNPGEVRSGGREASAENPGSREVRVDSPVRGSAYLGEKPGVAVAAGSSDLGGAPSSRAEGELSESAQAGSAAPGGRRFSASSAGRRDGSEEMPENAVLLPGSAPAESSDGEGRSGTSRGGAAGEGRLDDLESFAGLGDSLRTAGAAADAPAMTSGLTDSGDSDAVSSVPGTDDAPGWQREEERRRPPRVVNVASSAIDADSLLIVVGDFARSPDPAARNLFGELAGSVGKGVVLEARSLTPSDIGLQDSLLAVLSPEEVRDWPDSAVEKVGNYLKSGGHIWMDAARPAQAKPFMERLARAAGGTFAPLPETHPLSDDEIVDALTIGDEPAAVATYQDWRKDWRGGKGGGGTMRFLVRSLNYFLSGDADSGISLEPGSVDGTYIEPFRESIPDSLASGGQDGGAGLWDEFTSDSAASWRMPSWSDRGGITAVSDGEGGRALKMDLGASEKGRAAVYRTLTPPEDLSGVRYMTLDAYYGGEGEASLSAVFTVGSGGGWADYESVPLPLLAGWNRLRFNLDDETYRSLADGGADDVRMPSRERTGRAGFFLYRGADAPAVVLFRDIRMHGR